MTTYNEQYNLEVVAKSSGIQQVTSQVDNLAASMMGVANSGTVTGGAAMPAGAPMPVGGAPMPVGASGVKIDLPPDMTAKIAQLDQLTAALANYRSVGATAIAASQGVGFRDTVRDQLVQLQSVRDALDSYKVSGKNSAEITANLAAQSAKASKAMHGYYGELLNVEKAMVGRGLPPERYGEYTRTAGKQLMSGFVPTLPENMQGEAEAALATQAGGTMNPMDTAMRRVTTWGSAAFIIYGGIRMMSRMVKEIRDFDAALRALNAVMYDTEANLGEMSEAAFDIAQNYGLAAKEVVNGMTEIAKTGKGQSDVVELTKVAALAANVAEIEMSKSAEILTAAQKQFNIATADTIDIVDSWNEVSRRARVSTADLVDAMQAAGTAAGETGVSFHELNAITATIAEATGKGGAEIGTAFKAMMARTTQTKAIKALGEAGVSVYDESGALKDFSEILDEIAGKWENLTRAQQMNIAVAMAEKKRYQYFISLMDNWTRYLDLIQVSLDSEGSATRENAIIMEGLNKQIERFKAGAMEMKMGLSGIVQVTAGIGLQGLNIFTRFVDVLLRIPGANVAGSLLAIAGAYMLVTRVALHHMGTTGLKMQAFSEKNIKPWFSASKTGDLLEREGQAYQGFKEKYYPKPYFKIDETKSERYPEAYSPKVQVYDKFKQTTTEEPLPQKLADVMSRSAYATTADYIVPVQRGITGAIGDISKVALTKIGGVFKGIANMLFSPAGIFFMGISVISSVMDTATETVQARKAGIDSIISSAKESAKTVGDEYDKYKAKLEATALTRQSIISEMANTETSAQRQVALQGQLNTLADQEKSIRADLADYAEKIGKEYAFLLSQDSSGNLTINESALNSWKELEKSVLSLSGDKMRTAAAALYSMANQGKPITLEWREERNAATATANALSFGIYNKAAKPYTGLAVQGLPGTEDMAELLKAVIPMFGPDALNDMKEYGKAIVLTDEQLQQLTATLEGIMSVDADTTWADRIKVAAYLSGTSVNDLSAKLDAFKNGTLSADEQISLANTAFGNISEGSKEATAALIEHIHNMESMKNAEDITVQSTDTLVNSLFDTSFAAEELSEALEALKTAAQITPSGLLNQSGIISGMIGTSSTDLRTAATTLQTQIEVFQNTNESIQAFQNAATEAQTSAKAFLSEHPDIMQPYLDLLDSLPEAMYQAMAAQTAYSGMSREDVIEQFTKSYKSVKEGKTSGWATSEGQMELLNLSIQPMLDSIGGANDELKVQLRDALYKNLATRTAEMGPTEEAYKQAMVDTVTAYQDKIMESFKAQNSEFADYQTLLTHQESINEAIKGEQEKSSLALQATVEAAKAAAAAAQQLNIALQAQLEAILGLPSTLMQSLMSLESSMGMTAGPWTTKYTEGITQNLTQNLLPSMQSMLESGNPADLANLQTQAAFAVEGFSTLVSIDKAQQQAAKSATKSVSTFWDNMKTALEHFKALEQITQKQYIYGLKYLEETAPTLAKKIQMQEEVYKAEQELVQMRLDYGKKWLSHEVALEEMTKAEELAYYKQLLPMATKREDRWALEEEIFNLEREAVSDRVSRATKWVNHQVAMDAITKESQIEIYKKILEMAKASSDETMQWQIEEKLHELQKGSGEDSDFNKNLIRRAAGLASPLRISLGEYKKFMGEGSETENAKDMLSEFEAYMAKFGGTGEDAIVTVGNLQEIVENLIDTEVSAQMTTEELIGKMNSLGSALASEADAANNAANSTYTMSSSLQDLWNELQTTIEKIEEMKKSWSDSFSDRGGFDMIKFLTHDLPDMFKNLKDILGPLVTLFGSGAGGTPMPSSGGFPRITFPLMPNSGYSYSDSWGAPRSGGRTHKGTDIMAREGLPILAPDNGYVNFFSGGNAGLYAGVSSPKGLFYYMHMSAFKNAEGGLQTSPPNTGYPVRAGQIIGLVGATGNAKGGPPHIHFEWHPFGYGSPAVNPYGLLKQNDWRNLIPGMKTGGQIMSEGLIYAHPAEIITKAPTVQKLETFLNNSTTNGPSVQIYDTSAVYISADNMSKQELKMAMDEYLDSKIKKMERQFSVR